MKEVLVAFVKDSVEVFCQGCGQLRLWALGGTPSACGHCGSADIVMGSMGSELLARMRREWQVRRRRERRQAQGEFEVELVGATDAVTGERLSVVPGDPPTVVDTRVAVEPFTAVFIGSKDPSEGSS